MPTYRSAAATGRWPSKKRGHMESIRKEVESTTFTDRDFLFAQLDTGDKDEIGAWTSSGSNFRALEAWNCFQQQGSALALVKGPPGSAKDTKRSCALRPKEATPEHVTRGSQPASSVQRGDGGVSCLLHLRQPLRLSITLVRWALLVSVEKSAGWEPVNRLAILTGGQAANEAQYQAGQPRVKGDRTSAQVPGGPGFWKTTITAKRVSLITGSEVGQRQPLQSQSGGLEPC
ncbi:hypothetical protein AJ80_09866 [Polytolypa hystricis UAMH7299]|uniref:Uncharacterized protein n=1 Tax=Polytolypa hystricis (strain UAMH7299) TaxID=1447883 RepID=A0A2B7WHE9_POLH7|nr:hypothetical protein AJ80_09866 [Polytolypa hystricis UAMH7299]